VADREWGVQNGYAGVVSGHRHPKCFVSLEIRMVKFLTFDDNGCKGIHCRDAVRNGGDEW
jgi:hypothetical protein